MVPTTFNVAIVVLAVADGLFGLCGLVGARGRGIQPPPPPPRLALLSLLVSVDVKRHVYLLFLRVERVGNQTEWRTQGNVGLYNIAVIGMSIRVCRARECMHSYFISESSSSLTRDMLLFSSSFKEWSRRSHTTPPKRRFLYFFQLLVYIYVSSAFFFHYNAAYTPIVEELTLYTVVWLRAKHTSGQLN